MGKRRRNQGRSSNNGGRNRGNGGIRNRRKFGKVPRPLKNKPIQVRGLRYYSTSLNTAVTVTSSDIRNAIGTTIASSTAYYSIIDSIRLNRVVVSGTISGTAGSAAIILTWAGNNVPDVDYTAEVTLSNPGEINETPPPDSSAGWWYDDVSTTTNLFNVRYVSIDSGDCNVYVDIHFEYTLNDGTVTPITLSTGAAISGVTYLTLGGSGGLIPLGLVTAHT